MHSHSALRRLSLTSTACGVPLDRASLSRLPTRRRAVAGTDLATDLDPKRLNALNEYWEEARAMYAPFESGQLTGGADVYEHEMPGGQLTNLLYQSKQLGLSGQWSKIKHAYAGANRLLGDIVKVCAGPYGRKGLLADVIVTVCCGARVRV
jgi:pyruvate carboxylase